MGEAERRQRCSAAVRLLVSFIILASGPVLAEMRLNDDPPSARQVTTRADRCAAADRAGGVHVVWSDGRSGGSSSDIYYARSRDGGVAFEANLQVNSAFGPDRSHRDAVVTCGEDGAVSVVWVEEILGDGVPVEWRIQFARSTGGGRFTDQAAVSDESLSSAPKRAPSMAIDGAGNIHVVWEDARQGGPHAYYSVSTDHGASWSGDEAVAASTGAPSAYALAPSIAYEPVSGSIAVVYYGEFRYQTLGEATIDEAPTVYLSRSNGIGSGFECAVPVPDLHAQDTLANPSIATDGAGLLYVAWSDARNGDYDIWVSKSADGGVSFGGDVRASDDTTGRPQVVPTISATNLWGAPEGLRTVWIGYCDRRNGQWECCLARSFDDGEVFGPGRLPRFGMPAGSRTRPSLCVDAANAAHYVWTDEREDAGDIYYHRTARCYLIWDNDGGVTFRDADGSWESVYCMPQPHGTTSPDVEIAQALRLTDPAAIVITTPQDAELAEYSLRDYDAIFITLGWRPSGYSSAGTIEPSEASQLVNYLETGGAVYCEGNDGFEQYSQPADTLDSLFAHYFGGLLADTSVGHVDSIVGEATSVFQGLRFAYSPNDSGPHTSIDVIEALPGYGCAIFTSGLQENRIGNGLGVQSTLYRTVYFSFVLGALEDRGPNTKREVIGEVLDLLCPAQPLIELDIEADVHDAEIVSYCPGDTVGLMYRIWNYSEQDLVGNLHFVLGGEPRVSRYIASEACTVAARDSLIGYRYGDEIPLDMIPSENYRLAGYLCYSSSPQSITKGPVVAEDDFHVMIVSPVATRLIPDQMPTFIPAEGGPVGYTAVLVNTADRSVTVDVWTAVLGPVGPVIDPIFGPYTFTVDAEDSLSFHREDHVPGWAPPGEYCYCLNSGLRSTTRGPCRIESVTIWTQTCLEAYKLP